MFSFYTRRTQSKNRKQKLYKIVIETDEYIAYRAIQDAARAIIDGATIRCEDMAADNSSKQALDRLSKCPPRTALVP